MAYSAILQPPHKNSLSPFLITSTHGPVAGLPFLRNGLTGRRPCGNVVDLTSTSPPTSLPPNSPMVGRQLMLSMIEPAYSVSQPRMWNTAFSVLPAIPAPPLQL